MEFPTTQHAIELVSPNTLVLNPTHPVYSPGDEQILARVLCTGLCFSDVKLMRQFDAHARKSEPTGIDPAILAEVPDYCPGDAPTVPGHETAVEIVAMGKNVRTDIGLAVGQRCLVQTDYRWLRTAGSCSSFGYNFEGGLQEYVLFDQRIITSPEGKVFLLPTVDALAASAIAMTEPWSCVEQSYIVRERQAPKPNGRLLVCLGEGIESAPISPVEGLSAPPAESLVCRADQLGQWEATRFDDIVAFGCDAATVEALLALLDVGGLLNLVQCSREFQRPVAVPVGAIHYQGLRLTGTMGDDPQAGYDVIPESGEMRPGDVADLIGAGGPMGTIHAIRSLSQGTDLTIHASDIQPARLERLTRLARPLAEKNGLAFHPYDARQTPVADTQIDYIVSMLPDPEIVAESVARIQPGGIINIFAGIPVGIQQPIDLGRYLREKLYFIGTSGSMIDTMQLTLHKAETGEMDTNLSVAAITGLPGVIEGMAAVAKRDFPGKVICYPQCKTLPLTPLPNLKNTLPHVAQHLKNGAWTQQAENALLHKKPNP